MVSVVQPCLNYEHRVDYMTIKFRVADMHKDKGYECIGSHMKSSQARGVTKVEPVCEKQEE